MRAATTTGHAVFAVGSHDSAQKVEQLEGSVRDNRARRVDRHRAHVEQRGDVVRRNHAADRDLDIGTAEAGECVS